MMMGMMRTAAAVAGSLLLAGLAWGQDPVLRQVTSGPTLVAAERFGGEPRSILASRFDLDDGTPGAQRPYVGLNVDGADIALRSRAEITFTLDGATFEQRIGPRHLAQREGNCGAETSSVLVVSVASGGAPGDSEVAFDVEVSDGGGTGLAVGQSICLQVPDLSATLATVSEPGAEPPAMGVNVTARIRPLATGTGNAFPEEINGPDVDEGGAPTPGPITSKTLFQAVPAIAASLGTGGTVVFVNIEDRSRIAQGGELDPSGRTKTLGLRVGTLSIGLAEDTRAGRVWRLDGSRTLDADGVDATLSGRVLVSVAGPFQGDDEVVVGAGSSALEAEPDDGLAELEVPLRVTAGLPIVYLPGGEDLLRPSTFTAGAAYRFNDRGNRNAMILPMSTGTIRFADTNVEGYAYGVHRRGGADASFLRVTCEDALGCRTFLQCWSMDNDDYFGAAPDIPHQATAVWSSGLIAEVLGGGWPSGFGRCDIHSTGALAVQHMTRTGSGVLDNNSIVVGRSVGERALDAIRKAVNDICNSVGNPDPDGNPATDDATPCVPTLARP